MAAPFEITMKLVDLFFDKKAVVDKVGKARVRVLSKAGAYVRRSARSSLRRRLKTSAPGSPPSVHSKDATATLKNILFGYDSGTETVVVGPVQLNGGGQGNRGQVPRLMEHGGSGVVVRRYRSGKVFTETVNYAPRPFMAPALAANLQKFPTLFGDSV